MAIAVLFVVILRFSFADSCAVDLLRKRGLLAHASAAFLKNCCTEKLFSLCSVCRKTMLLGKTVFRIRQKGVPPLLLPASVLQLPRCLARICNFFHKNNPIAIWQVLKLAIAAGKTDCKIQFASQTWATRPHLGSIFEKLLHRKTFWFVQRLSENHAIRKNGLPHPAKGGSTPAFACQRAAIAPLPCPNL